MFQEYEIISIILTLGLLGYMVFNRGRFQRIPAHSLLLITFTMMITGWFLTVLEEVLLHDLFDLLEHLAYMAGALTLSAWCRRVFTEGTETGQ
jgi:hypothetical protein